MSSVMFTTLFSFISDIFFPPRCLGCEKYLVQAESKKCFLCVFCYDMLIATTHGFFYCPVCSSRCPEPVNVCHPESSFVLATTGFYTHTPLRQIIHALKYDFVMDALQPIRLLITRSLTSLLGDVHCAHRFFTRDARSEKEKDKNAFLIIPIPLYPQKKRERGFNQAELIAKELATKLTTYDVVNLNTKPATSNLRLSNLIRIKKTKSQTTLKKEERFANIAHCFALKNPQEISGKNIVLVDDVFTSGATMREAVRVLRAAGARKIVAFVLAKA